MPAAVTMWQPTWVVKVFVAVTVSLSVFQTVVGTFWVVVFVGAMVIFFVTVFVLIEVSAYSDCSYSTKLLLT